MTEHREKQNGHFEPVGNVAATLVEKIRPKEYREYLLRQAISDAVETLGKEATQEIVDEELAA